MYPSNKSYQFIVFSIKAHFQRRGEQYIGVGKSCNESRMLLTRMLAVVTLCVLFLNTGIWGHLTRNNSIILLNNWCTWQSIVWD